MGRPKGTLRPGIKYLTPAEWSSFQHEVKDSLLYDFLFNLMFTVAGRVTEITHLRLSSIDERVKKLQVQGVKGGTLGRYSMEAVLWRKYQRWMKKRTELLGPLQSHFLFPSLCQLQRSEDLPISEQAVKTEFKRVIRALGLNPDLSCHALRHTAAVYLLRQGIPAPEIQEHLRQKTADSVMQYLRLFGAEAQEASERRMAVLGEFVK
jgi:integrase